MQTHTIKAPANPGRQLGLSGREYFALGKFSNDADKFGLKTTSVGKVLGLGCRLQLSSSNHNYEVLLNGGIALLGRIEQDGKRIKLCEAGTNIESGWNAILDAVKRSEGVLQ